MNNVLKKLREGLFDLFGFAKRDGISMFLDKAVLKLKTMFPGCLADIHAIYIPMYNDSTDQYGITVMDDPKHVTKFKIFYGLNKELEPSLTKDNVPYEKLVEVITEIAKQAYAMHGTLPSIESLSESYQDSMHDDDYEQDFGEANWLVKQSIANAKDLQQAVSDFLGYQTSIESIEQFEDSLLVHTHTDKHFIINIKEL